MRQPFSAACAKPILVAQQAAHAHDQHVAPAGERLGNKFRQSRLAGGFDGQIRALDQFMQAERPGGGSRGWPRTPPLVRAS